MTILRTEKSTSEAKLTKRKNSQELENIFGLDEVLDKLARAIGV